MRITMLFMAILLFAFACNAADVNGKWLAEVNDFGGKSERVFTFEVAGEKLTGTIANWQISLAVFEEKGKPAMTGTLKTQRGEPQKIVDGKISGTAISFAVVAEMFGQEMKTEYKGTISGEEIKLTVEQGGGMGGPAQPQEIVAKRMK
jgi:hypothetical protein